MHEETEMFKIGDFLINGKDEKFKNKSDQVDLLCSNRRVDEDLWTNRKQANRSLEMIKRSE